MKKIKIITIIMLMIIFISCENTKIINNSSEIKSPVKLQYIEIKGIKYMIASGLFGDSGCAIANLTLDSIQIEFYKQSLIKIEEKKNY